MLLLKFQCQLWYQNLNTKNRNRRKNTKLQQGNNKRHVRIKTRTIRNRISFIEAIGKEAEAAIAIEVSIK